MDLVLPTVDTKIAIAPLAMAAATAVPAVAGKVMGAAGKALGGGATLSKPKKAAAIQYPIAQTMGGQGHTNPGSKPNKNRSSAGPTNQQVDSRGATDVIRSRNQLAGIDPNKRADYVPIPAAPKPRAGIDGMNAAHLALGMAPLALGVVDSVRRNRQDEDARYEAEKAHLLNQIHAKAAGVADLVAEKAQKAKALGASYVDGLGHHVLDQIEDAQRVQPSREHLQQIEPQRQLV